MKKTLVLKFGGAAVASPESFSHIADIIKERWRTCKRIVIVVSAMGDTTDRLIELARAVHPEPPRREYDMLVSVGERVSIALLAMALDTKNLHAVSFTGSQSGIITCPRHSDARIIDVRPHRLLPPLDAGKVAIVAGFQGVSRHGEITTLGRGGSDTTAVALGAALKASVEFYKDVKGIFDKDPHVHSDAKLLPELTHEQAYNLALTGAEVLSHRCISMAWKNHIALNVRSFHDHDCEGTWIKGISVESLPMPCYEEEL